MTAQPETFKRFVPHILIAALLVIALNPGNAIGYYTIMRWIVCGAFSYLAVDSHTRKETPWVWVWGVAAGIYNPIVPVEASRELWSLVNIASIGLVAFDVLIGRRVLESTRRVSLAFARMAGSLVLRLALAVVVIVAVLFIINFIITRWG